MGRLAPVTVDPMTLNETQRIIRLKCENLPRREKRALDAYRIECGRQPLWFLPRSKGGTATG